MLCCRSLGFLALTDLLILHVTLGMYLYRTNVIKPMSFCHQEYKLCTRELGFKKLPNDVSWSMS